MEKTIPISLLCRRAAGLLRGLVACVALFLSAGLSSAWSQECCVVEQNAFDGYRVSLQFALPSIARSVNGEVVVQSPGLHSCGIAGAADLPVWSRLIVVPEGATPQIRLLDTTRVPVWREHAMVLRRVPLPATKGGVAEEGIPTDTVLPVASIRVLGTMQGRRIARLTVSPFVADGHEGTLSMFRTLTVEVSYPGADEERTWRHWRRYPFAALPVEEPRSKNRSCSNGWHGPVAAPLLLLVSPEEYRPSLRPFVMWKRQKGIEVEEIYVHTTDRDSIKARIAPYFDTASSSAAAPAFVLLVGSTTAIPAFHGNHHIPGLSGQVSDLYYAEFTGDYLPEAQVGRWLVSDATQLEAVVEKTIRYERCLTADPGYLGRALLVAGDEPMEPAPTATNGSVNYVANELPRALPSIDTSCFYNETSNTLRDTILARIREGAGLVMYSGHARSRGWYRPTIQNATIDSLPENDSPALWVNNACSSNDITSDCFGSHLLCKRRGGAIGVIGSNNETLWNEDFYWSVGAKPLATHPSYDSAALGAFDRLLHSHGESPGKQVLTQGQLLQAGNFAVTQSGSPYDAVYWEMYHLLGDPSLMPFVGPLQELSLQLLDSAALGATSLRLQGTPFSYAALRNDTTLLGVCLLDSTGSATLDLCRPIEEGFLSLTATKQNCRTWCDTLSHGALSIVPVAQPWCRLYPNPAKEQVTFFFEADEPVDVCIFDEKGLLVDKFCNNSSRFIQYSAHNLRLGIYFVVVRGLSGTTTQRLVITH